MTRIAFADIPIAEVREDEMRREGKSYTAGTLRLLQEMYPGAAFTMLIGTDMLLTFDRWYRYTDILSLCNLVFVRRETDSELDGEIFEKISFLEKQTGRKIRHIKIDPVEISSSELRQMLQDGEDTGNYLPEKVENFIKEKGIYTK